MGESKMRKIIALGIMLLFLGMTISSSTGLYLNEQSIKPLSSGNILYVGGNGSGNYSKIQDAINDSVDGDTVYVYDDSSPYYESVHINNSINLIGEGRNTTIIDPSAFESNAIGMTADSVKISGFTIQNTREKIYAIYYTKINYCEISGNYFKNNGNGIGLSEVSHSKISGNIITNNSGYQSGTGITVLYDSENNTITDNIITNNQKSGIHLRYSSNNIITGNTIRDNSVGIELRVSSKNNISNNRIYENKGAGIAFVESANRNIIYRNNFELSQAFSISLEYSFFNNILENNFMNRTILGCIYNVCGFLTRWDGNFWIGARSFPKVIPMARSYGTFPFPLLWVQFDWHPALEPYDIEV